MRLIIEYTVGDGCTYHCINTEPVEYESPEAFAVDFEKAVKDAVNCHDFFFAGRAWVPSNHGYYDSNRVWWYTAPDILTVDEWFHSNGIQT